MCNLQENENVFLNSEIYSNFRSLICSERILLSNVYLRFNKVDLRPLLTGSLVAHWDNNEKLFLPENNLMKQFLINNGSLEITNPNNTERLTEIISQIRPKKDLLIIQQGALINDQKLYTDICLFNDGEKIVFSVIREGLEGFSFNLCEDVYKSYELAYDKNVSLLHSEKLEKCFEDNDIFEFIKNTHNLSINGSLVDIKMKMLDHVQANLSMSNQNAEQLPTFIALKLCGPVCWYFNRFIQSCLGIQEHFLAFNDEQIKRIEALNILSAKTRNMGLKLSKSQKDRDRLALEKLIYQLIDQIDSLSSLTIV